jgi:hypothetical protein
MTLPTAHHALPEASSKPIYVEEEFFGAADPSVIWNCNDRAWWMFYTVRRATLGYPNAWNGNPIGIAVCRNGKS